MGLLLVTKALPAGGGHPATMRRVCDAVGFPFLDRLFLSFRPGSGIPTDEAALDKHIATSALGLAILASFARVPDLAGAEEMVAKLPLLFKVGMHAAQYACRHCMLAYLHVAPSHDHAQPLILCAHHWNCEMESGKPPANVPLPRSLPFCCMHPFTTMHR